MPVRARLKIGDVGRLIIAKHGGHWLASPGRTGRPPDSRACIVAFYHDGAAFERANDGSWSPYQAVADVDALDHRSLACFGSVLLG